MSGKTDSVSYAIRWRPDFRYCDNKLMEVSLENFKSTEPSVTDKEAYRVTLASLRGELAQGSGNPKVGSYSLKEGEEYDPKNDFSFLNRKDLTVVELDEYIKIWQRKLEEADNEVAESIKLTLAQAQKKHDQLVNDTSDKSSQVKE